LSFVALHCWERLRGLIVRLVFLRPCVKCTDRLWDKWLSKNKKKWQNALRNLYIKCVTEQPIISNMFLRS